MDGQTTWKHTVMLPPSGTLQGQRHDKIIIIPLYTYVITSTTLTTNLTLEYLQSIFSFMHRLQCIFHWTFDIWTSSKTLIAYPAVMICANIPFSPAPPPQNNNNNATMLLQRTQICTCMRLLARLLSSVHIPASWFHQIIFHCLRGVSDGRNISPVISFRSNCDANQAN